MKRTYLPYLLPEEPRLRLRRVTQGRPTDLVVAALVLFSSAGWMGLALSGPSGWIGSILSSAPGRCCAATLGMATFVAVIRWRTRDNDF